MALKFRTHIDHGKKWKGLNVNTTYFVHDRIHPSQKHYDRLVELKDKYSELTYQNDGYDKPYWLKDSHPDQLKEISSILSESFLGFNEFNHFKLRKDGSVVIRLQHQWSSGAPSFTGVGYIDLEYWNPEVHASLYLYKQELITEHSSTETRVGWMQGLNLSGYAGVLANGNIVDRREFPNAVPVQKNTMLGIVEPKKIEHEKE